MTGDPDTPQPFDDPPPSSGRRTGEDAALPHYVPSDGRDVSTPAGDALARHEARLLAIAGVVGVGVGIGLTGAVILVYVRNQEARSRVPRVLDGVPVELVVSGEIDAYGAAPGNG